ncbi:MAG: hypothetical protein WAV15_00025 [Minisyncoccia bacterium]
MTWALKRQLFYIIVLVFFVSIFGFLIIYPTLSKAPSCSDLQQNGDEAGVDCGGSCARACVAQTDDISVQWARAFKVIPGRYNAVAYITNHNKKAAIQRINYRFRFGDANNIYIGKREGTTYVPPGGNFAVFEPGIDVGNSIPVYVTFEFTEPPLWLQVPEEKIEQLKVLVSNIELTGEGTSPRLSATIKNNSLFTIPSVSVIAVLHEAGGNAIAASRTFLSEMAPLQNSSINFTWPEPWAGEVVEKELIPMYDIFSVKLQ